MSSAPENYFGIIGSAQIIARLAHKGQTRGAACGDEPYYNHCIRVANTVASFAPVWNKPLVVAAGYLHDVIEDCEVSADELYTLVSGGQGVSYGATRVVNLVLQVTHVSKPTDGNRALRRGLDRAHVAKTDEEGATLKCCDIEDNLTSPFDDEGWAHKYFAEKKAELDVLTHAYPPALELAMAAWKAGPNIVPGAKFAMGD